MALRPGYHDVSEEMRDFRGEEAHASLPREVGEVYRAQTSPKRSGPWTGVSASRHTPWRMTR